MEKTYAFIKNGIVENILVFANQDDQLAETIKTEQGYDSFVYIGEATDPIRWSTYDGQNFTAPTDEYLISIGVMEPTPAEVTPAE